MTFQPSDTQSNASPFDLYDETLGEMLWPASKRIRYCAVSGAPWAMVLPSIVRQAVIAFGASDRPKLDRIIAETILFEGVSPLWQSKTPQNINANRSLDPAGFCVYMIDSMLRQEYREREQEATDRLMFKAEWRHSMHKLYTWTQSALDSGNRKWVDRLNEIILLCSANQCLPTGISLKDKNPGSYADKQAMETLIKTLAVNYQKRKKAMENQPLFHAAAQPARMEGGRKIQPFNSIHAQAALLATGTNGFDEKSKKKLVELHVESLMQSMNIGYTNEETRRAKSLTGKDNAFHLLLDRALIQVNAVPMVAKPKVELKPAGSAFTFGQRKG